MPNSEPEEVAVLDVGSNSVRLVVFRVDGRAITPILNEKVLAGLGRELRATGKLSPQGIETALIGMRRFVMLLKALEVRRVEAVATAAVRDAADGRAFVARVAEETGLRLRVLAGEEEARYSALGVLAGAPNASGVVGDLGGSSLELIAIGPAGALRGETFPCGPLAFLSDGPLAAERVAAQIDMLLETSTVLGKQSGGTFYAVGGAWRALGRIDILLHDHPLGVLHHHAMTRADALRVVEFVRKQSRRSLEKLDDASARRADTLPLAAIALDRVLRRGAFDNVVLSTYGLREGLVFDRLSPVVKAVDPLLASAEAFGAQSQRARAFGAALQAWLEPVFAETPPAFSADRDRALRGAATRLADIGGAFHPEQRGRIIFDLVVSAPFTGVTHAERAFLAGATHHRYTKAAPEGAPAFAKLLDDGQRRAAAALGAAMRLGADLSARSDVLLAACGLSLEEGVLTLKAASAFSAVITDQSHKRLEALGLALGVPVRVG